MGLGFWLRQDVGLLILGVIPGSVIVMAIVDTIWKRIKEKIDDTWNRCK